jgi:rod shape-determining protein MreD
MKYLLPLFLYACSLTLTLPLLFSSFHLLFFAPFLVLSFYRSPLPYCLWWALICGFIIDLLSSHMRLGAYAFNYCLTTLCLYRYQLYFFEDRFSTLPVMTFFFSLLSALIHVFFAYLTGLSFILSWSWLANDLFWMPLQNALYAIVAFTLPFELLANRRRRSAIRRRAR